MQPPAIAAPPNLLSDARALSRTLSELIRVVQFRDRDRSCCYGISVSQCYALKGVCDAGSMTVNELSAHLYLDKSTASRIANGLVERGLLARTRDVDDGRIVRLVSTPEGSVIHQRIEEDLVREYAELLSDFDDDVRPALTELVQRLGGSFSARVDASGGSCCTIG